MDFVRYLLRSLAHYRFAYLGVLAGAILGATVLLGALFAGDSVKASLRKIGQNRIGQTTHLVVAGDRFFRQELAADLAAAAHVKAAPVLYARGTAANSENRAVANQVQLVGVTNAFWQFAPTPTEVPLDAARQSIAINPTLARRLQVTVGSTLVVRLQKPGILSGNAPVAGGESTLESLRCTVAAIVDDASFGRFSLEATQVPSASVFLPIEMLQESVGYPGRANLLLINASSAGTRPASPTTQELEAALAKVAQLADYGLALKWLEQAGSFEVSSNRIFIDPKLAAAVIGAVPSTQPVLSYLVNEFRIGNRTTPYSIATATSPAAAPFLPAQLGARDIVLNDWLAKDLQASIGDEVRLTFFQTGAEGTLVEKAATFRVHSVIPLAGKAADNAWMPDFPGISDSNSPSDWDPGLPLDLERIRPQDDRYWEDFRGAPKAFLSAAAGQEIWSTRWGAATALRIPFAREQEAALTTTLLAALSPPMNQLLVRDFGGSASEAANPAVDFGGLFAGMSFFLIIAALGLVAMLFQLSLLQRNREDAVLGAVGLPGRRLVSWRLAEGAVLLLLGCGIGLPLAALYTRGILKFLETIWAGTGAGSTFLFAAQPMSIAAGGAAFVGFSLLAIWLAIRKQARRALSIRLAASTEDAELPPGARRSSLLMTWGAAFIGVTAIALSGRVLPAQGAFYLGGFAFLAAGIGACRWWMVLPPKPAPATESDARSLGLLNLKARRSRSLTVVGLIASAVFMVLSVASFRKQVGDDWLERSSGTGGFSYWVQTTSALNAARDGQSRGFEIFEPHQRDLGAIVPVRAGVGDNVNCFNLNTTTQPQLLALDAAKLAALNAFQVKLPSLTSVSGWNVLSNLTPSGAMPALVDATTLQWALKRKVGDVFTYADENGQPFSIQIVGTLPDSLFQGYLLVDEALFLARFPSNPGYSIFLVDALKPENLEALRKQIEASVSDVGGRVDVTREVLAAFHQIENTYIAIFNLLGTLGVILGSLGLAIVVARNLQERRGEFAVMTAMGIPREVLGRMVFAEFGRLIMWGIGIGAVASIVAVWPNITSLPTAPTLLLVTGLLVGIVALNLVCGWLVFSWSVRNLRAGWEQATA